MINFGDLVEIEGCELKGKVMRIDDGGQLGTLFLLHILSTDTQAYFREDQLLNLRLDIEEMTKERAEYLLEQYRGHEIRINR